MNKLGYMKTPLQRFTRSLVPSRYYKQPEFEDKFLRNGASFKHTWPQMAHMHELRLWTITYSPSEANNL